MKLAYSEVGSGHTVVLLHGFPLSREMWCEQLSSLESEYRVITPDLRGHGESPAPEGVYSMDEMADDVIELLDALHASEPFVLGGLSMGGYVALALFARYPSRVRGLMLLDTRATADTPEAAREREKTAQEVLAAGSVQPVVEKMLPRLFSKKTLELDKKRVALVRAVMERTSPQGIAGALRGMAIRPDRRAELAGLSAPTLVLGGAEDVITPPPELRSLAAAIPAARLEIIPGAGHMAPYENPAAANAVILEFLRGLHA
jgi:pimeloyl-ACP methyl ester carboxylesterase